MIEMAQKMGFWVLYKNGDNVVDIKEGDLNDH